MLELLKLLVPSAFSFLFVTSLAVVGIVGLCLASRPFSWLEKYLYRKSREAPPCDKPQAPAGLRPTMEKNTHEAALHALRVDMAQRLARLLQKEPYPPSKEEALPCIKAYLSDARLASGKEEDLATASREIAQALLLAPPAKVAVALEDTEGRVPAGWHFRFT